MDEAEQQSLAFVKLQEDVQKLILNVVVNDLITNHTGVLRAQIEFMVKAVIQQEMQQFRVTKVGYSATY